MDWFQRKNKNAGVPREDLSMKREAQAVARIITAGRTRLAGRETMHFYVDPDLATNFDINLHLMKKNDQRQASVSRKDDTVSDFKEKTIVFASKLKRSSNYSCSIVFQKPEDKVYCVSAYMTDESLGRYAFKANYYFRKSSRTAALRCFKRVLKTVKAVKADVIDGEKPQGEVPYLLKKALQNESGEINPKSNKTAVYLNPSNVAKQTTIGSENIVTIPKKKSIVEDLEMDG